MSDPWEVDNVGLLDYDSSKRRYTMNTKFTLTIQAVGGTSQTIEVEADLPNAGPQFLDQTEQALLRVFHSLQSEAGRIHGPPSSRNNSGHVWGAP